MVKYIGIKTADEAMRIKETFIRNTKKHNRTVVTQGGLIAFAILCVAALVAWIVWSNSESNRESAVPIIGGIAFVIAMFVFISSIDEVRSVADWNTPFAYQFFKATDGLRILKTDVSFSDKRGNRDLLLTVENKNNEVSHERICDFKTITRTDINDLIVDLDQGIIHLPYKDYSW